MCGSVSRGQTALFGALVSVGLAAGGCGSVRASTTPRTADEQLLVSTAAERSVSRIDLRPLEGKKVFIDDSRFASVDKPYVLSALFDRVSSAKGLLVRKRESADVVVEVRSAGLGTWDGRWVVGVPYPLADGFTPPDPEEDVHLIFEIGYVLHEGWSRVQLFAYERESGKNVLGSRDAWGYAYKGFFDDIYPTADITVLVKSRFE